MKPFTATYDPSGEIEILNKKIAALERRMLEGEKAAIERERKLSERNLDLFHHAEALVRFIEIRNYTVVPEVVSAYRKFIRPEAGK